MGDTNTTERFIKGLEHAKHTLNTLPVTGASNCQLVVESVLNLEIIIACIKRGELVSQEDAAVKKEAEEYQ